MSKELITSQHALNSSLDQVAAKSSHSQWQESQHNEPRECANVNRMRLTAVMECAANNPIGLAILARRTLYQETHLQAVQKLATLTRIPVSEGASRVRVHSAKFILSGK